MADDRRITRSAARKQWLLEMEEEQQGGGGGGGGGGEVKKQKKFSSLADDDDVVSEYPQEEEEVNNNKKLKNKKLMSLIKARELPWLDFFPILGSEDYPEQDNPQFYRKIISLTYNLPNRKPDKAELQRLLVLNSPENFTNERPFTDEERKNYMEKLHASEGFGVLDVPDHISDLRLVRPFPKFEQNSRVFERVKNCSKLALHFYNQEHKGENYQFVKVLRVNSRRVGGSVYYLTFLAKPMYRDYAPPVNFQARVYGGNTGAKPKVYSCRPEPKSS